MRRTTTGLRLLGLAAARRAPRWPLPESRKLPWPPAKHTGGLVPEPEGWAFLRGLGLPLPAHRYCRSPAEAAAAFAALRARPWS